MERPRVAKRVSDKPIHHGFITTRFIVTDRTPLIDDVGGRTTGQLVDAHIAQHMEGIEKERAYCAEQNIPFRGPSALHSITIDFPTEE